MHHFNFSEFLHKSAVFEKEYNILKDLKLNARNRFCKQLFFSKVFHCIAIFREINIYIIFSAQKILVIIFLVWDLW